MKFSDLPHLKKTITKKLFLRINDYKPQHLYKPERVITNKSAWEGLELIIEDLINTFDLQRKQCIEFGVEFGFSSVVFSNYFDKVVGVDTFEGDIHTVHKNQHYEETQQRLSVFPNITLEKSDYRDWIVKDNERYNLAHVDIVHTYKDTYDCGLWAAQHSDCTIFHDTESFIEVRKAVIDIAKATGQKIYNYPFHHGLGILVDPKRIKANN